MRTTELLGIGTKYELGCGRQRIAVIERGDGTRELYVFAGEDREQPSAVIHLDEEDARKLAAVLSGTFFSD